MEKYVHRVQYYETDRMGITHHSNYIRWMEEARVDFMARIGWPYDRMEDEGIASPVLAVNARYKTSTTFGDEVTIDVKVAEYTGVRLVISYRMENQDGKLVCEGSTEHCFVGKDGKLLKLKRGYPEFHETLLEMIPDSKISENVNGPKAPEEE